MSRATELATSRVSAPHSLNFLWAPPFGEKCGLDLIWIGFAGLASTTDDRYNSKMRLPQPWLRREKVQAISFLLCRGKAFPVIL